MTSLPKKQKLYCYVDETGQDTQGRLFLVSVAISETERDALLQRLESIEHASGKGKLDWNRAENAARLRYIETILTTAVFKGELFFSLYRSTTEYLACTAVGIAKAIQPYTISEYKAAIFIDGLKSKHEVQQLTHQLRKLGVQVKSSKRIPGGTQSDFQITLV
jgi:hypothetical protein